MFLSLLMFVLLWQYYFQITMKNADALIWFVCEPWVYPEDGKEGADPTNQYWDPKSYSSNYKRYYTLSLPLPCFSFVASGISSCYRKGQSGSEVLPSGSCLRVTVHGGRGHAYSEGYGGLRGGLQVRVSTWISIQNRQQVLREFPVDRKIVHGNTTVISILYDFCLLLNKIITGSWIMSIIVFQTDVLHSLLH